MSIVVFIVLAVVAAMAIVYPLLPGAASSPSVSVVTDGDIEQAVRHLRRSRSKSNLSCSSCGQPYQAGDRFCVGCGATLSEVAPAAPACPACGATLHEGDRFCPKCGHNVAAGEVA
jgi:predicted amidophosphoribosyltransferase